MLEMLLLLLIILFLGAISWLKAEYSRKSNEEIQNVLKDKGWTTLVEWLEDRFSR